MFRIGILIYSLCILVMTGYAQDKGRGIHFIEGEEWQKILQIAQEQDKYIFMDCYTSWCGPCKALSKDIFTKNEVGDFFNTHFINVKYDMEKGVGKELRNRYQSYIIGYPTLLLIDKKGEVVHQMAGFQEADVLIDGMKAGMEGQSLFAFRKRYAAGERSLEFIKAYVKALNGAFLKDDIEKIVKEYMQNMPLEKLQDQEVWELVGTYIKDPYSPQFEYVVFHLDRLAVRLKFDRFQLERQLNWALEKALKQLIELKKDEQENILPYRRETGKIDTLMRLIDRANLKRAEEYRAKKRIFELQLDGNWPEVYNYLTVCRDIKALGYSDSYLNEMIQYMTQYCKDKKLLRKLLILTEQLQVQEDKNESRLRSFYYDTLAMLYEKLGNKTLATEYREKDKRIKAERAKEFEEFMKKN